MIYSVLKTINSMKRENYHLNKFLSASHGRPQFADNFCTNHCLMTLLLIWSSLIFKESSFPVLLTKLLIFPFQNLPSLCSWVSDHLDLVRNRVKPCNSSNFPILQYNTYTSCESPNEHTILDSSNLTIIKETSTNLITN